MELSLEKNAFSSLSISIDCFKEIYYNYGKISESVYEEKTKIGLVFLENSVELLIKAILHAEDENLIFITNRKGERKTITYSEAVKMYCGNSKTYNITHSELNERHLKKVNLVLDELGDLRNKITHYCFDNISYDDVVCTFINTFDVFYNYLYKDLIELEEVGDYFISDSWEGVETIHGTKPLFSDSFIYNNVRDLFDELLGDSHDHTFMLCLQNPMKKIDKFAELYNSLVASDADSFHDLSEDSISIERFWTNNNNGFDFTIRKEDNSLEVNFRYIPFYNVGVFYSEIDEIYFIVDFTNEKIYIYKHSKDYPSFNEPEEDRQWESDLKEDLCYKRSLSLKFLQEAIISILKREFSE